MTSTLDTILVPIDLTAFVLSPPCFDSSLSKIAPITQPNYIGLRINDFLIQHDVLEQIDFHLCSPAEKNPRVADLGTFDPTTGKANLRMNRLGVYLHWSLPRMYRSGAQQADGSTPPKDAVDGGNDISNPTFRHVPNRWLVVRHLRKQEPEGKLKDFQTWVIESNRQRNIDELDELDLETDVTPFVKYEGDGSTNDDILKTQAEIFIGKRQQHSGWENFADVGWNEVPDPNMTGHVPLTVMDTSNPMFPDYTPHNSSVFSMVDSFAYRDSNDPKQPDQHLTHAEADYFVIGWHSSEDDEPLGKKDLGTLEDRLSTLLLNMDPTKDPNNNPDEIKAALGNTGATQVIMHGGIYSVTYDIHTSPHSMADDAAAKFSSAEDVESLVTGDNTKTLTPAEKMAIVTKAERMEPLSVGATPLDAIITFINAHSDNLDQVFDSNSKDLAADILKMAALLYNVDDSYDSSVKAQDLLYSNNWKSSQGGFEWKFAQEDPVGAKDPSKTATPPSAGDLNALVTLNEAQRRYDALQRKIQSTQWNLFAEWWKYLSDGTNADEDRVSLYKPNVTQFKSDIVDLRSQATALDNQINAIVAPVTPAPPPSPGQPATGPTAGSTTTGSTTIGSTTAGSTTAKVPFKKVPQASYFDTKEPCLCIVGLDSGWPSDFMDSLPVMLENRLKNDKTGASTVFGTSPNPLPDRGMLKDASAKILSQCISLIGVTDETTFPKGYKLWGDKNPFFPMFIEWEANYYHIGREYFNVALKRSPVAHAHLEVRHEINVDLQNDSTVQAAVRKDLRVISGRVLILPQPVFSLANLVKTALSNPPKDLGFDPNVVLDPITGVNSLKFLSAPLTGITEHLLTRYIGTHVTPLVREQKKGLTPLLAAISASAPLDFKEDGIRMIDLQSATTPYGNLLDFDGDVVPFKGVTHGQMMFTKINIVDKFGQAICLPLPNKPALRIPVDPPPSVHPCMSDYMSPDILADGRLNTIYEEPVTSDGQWPLCRFIQLNPSINQSARINSTFMVPTGSSTFPFWREANQDVPENPVFGWIVVNYQDYGLQIFLPDGRFYREIRNRWDNSSAASGTNVTPRWLPFEAPDNKITGSVQLNQFIERLTNPDDKTSSFIYSFFDMINGAIQTMPFPPSDYASYANSLVGKPLALVNVGWMLELAEPAVKAQNTLGPLPKDEAAELAGYQFPIKIGDAERPFDGVVGYFKNQEATGETTWDTMYSYFPPTTSVSTTPASGSASQTTPKIPISTITSIEPSNFELLQPKYINPTSPYHVDGVTSRDYTSYTQAREAEMIITTLLIDPYTPLHAYSPILPIKSLQLPPWTIQAAFTRMTAFFRLGPQLISVDVPAYVAAEKLEPDTWVTKSAQQAAGTATGNPIRLPIAGKKGLWQWLQPYDVQDTLADGTTTQSTKFNSLDVMQEDNGIRKDAPPYTYVEGYLQLARPLLKSDVPLD